MKKIIISSALVLSTIINSFANDIEVKGVQVKDHKNTVRIHITSKDTISQILLQNPNEDIFYTTKVNSTEFDKIISLNVPTEDLNKEFVIIVIEKNKEIKYRFVPSELLIK